MHLNLPNSAPQRRKEQFQTNEYLILWTKKYDDKETIFEERENYVAAVHENDLNCNNRFIFLLCSFNLKSCKVCGCICNCIVNQDENINSAVSSY